MSRGKPVQARTRSKRHSDGRKRSSEAAGLRSYEQAMRALAISKEVARTVVKDYAQILEQARRAWPAIQQSLATVVKTFQENPFFPVIQKMGRSRGLLGSVDGPERVIFVPEAVLMYGFAHLPSESDPDGRQFEALPSTPNDTLRGNGAYLFLPRRRDGRRGLPKEEDDPLFSEAQEVYRQSGNVGIEPYRVLHVLLMVAGIETVWLQIDPTGDLDDQYAQLKVWLPRAQRTLYRRHGRKRHRKTEAARDTLIYTLKESARLLGREIAQRVFPNENAEEAVVKVRQSVRRTRHALKAAGYLASAGPASGSKS